MKRGGYKRLPGKKLSAIHPQKLMKIPKKKTKVALRGKTGRVTTKRRGRPPQSGSRPPFRAHTTAQERREKRI